MLLRDTRAAWLAAFALSACAGARPAMIPRSVLAGDPDHAQVSLSPDGARLSWLAPYQGVVNVWTAPIGAPDRAEPLTKSTGHPILLYRWAFDGKHLLYLKDDAGDEGFHVFAVEVASGAVRDLTPVSGIRAGIKSLSPARPGEVIVPMNARDRRYHDLYAIDLASGERTELERNEAGYLRYVLDPSHRVRLAVETRPDGGTVIHEKTEGGYRPLFEVAQEDSFNTEPWGYGEDGVLYMADSRGRETSAAFAIDPSGAARLLAEHPKADVDRALFHPRTRALQAVSFTHARTEWKAIDPAIAAHLELLRRELRGDLSIEARSLDDARWIVAERTDDGPVRFHLYETGEKRLRFLFPDRKALEGLALARMEPRVIRARDGLELVSYLTVPREGSAPFPLVMLVHGGPWTRDVWGYSDRHQWLASRGYAVLSVNFRGSTGLGKSFLNAGTGQWGRGMHEDILDAVEWAAREGIADRARVAIMGSSYGGYEVLVALSETPRAFACGVAVAAPSNLVTLLEANPPYWAAINNLFIRRIGGDHRTEEGRRYLLERSPLEKADRIERPLLIAQGSNDPRVKPAESERIVAAMVARKIPVTYAVFPDEGHELLKPANRSAFDAVTEQFLAQCLGGPALSLSGELEGSSMTVPVGGELIEGLVQGRGDSAGIPTRP